MEMILRWKIPAVINLTWEKWEKAVKICLAFAISGILCCCINTYVSGYEAMPDEVKGNRQIIVSDCGINVTYNGKNMKSIPGNLCMQKIFLTKIRNKVSLKSSGMKAMLDLTAEKPQNIKPAAKTERDIAGDNRQEEVYVNPIIIENADDVSSITEKTGEESSTDREETAVNEDTGRTAGFYIDSQGYIAGITNELDLTDGILAIVIDESCIGIRKEAFCDVDEDVTEIYIPANIRDIEADAFQFFPNLMYIEVAEDNPSYTSVDGILYSKAGEEIMRPAGR